MEILLTIVIELAKIQDTDAFFRVFLMCPRGPYKILWWAAYHGLLTTKPLRSLHTQPSEALVSL